MDTLILGQWNVICDRCGVKCKSGDVTKTWDGLIVHRPEVKQGCFETRHPQDFVRAVHDNQSVEFTRPEPADVFVAITFNCDTADFVYKNASEYALGETVSVIKDDVTGAVSVNGTVSVQCTLRIR